MFLIILSSLYTANINENVVRLSNNNFVCYANSMFQCLNSCAEIGNYFRLKDQNFTDARDKKLRDIFLKIESNKGREIDLQDDYKSLQLILNDANWKGFGFFDPKELLCILLSKGATETRMIQPKSLFCPEIRNDQFSSFFILKGIKGSDYMFNLSNIPSITESLHSYTDTLGRIKRYPEVLLISYPKKQTFTKNLKNLNIRSKEYKLRSFIVYKDEIHYYAVTRQLDNFIKVDDHKISIFNSLDLNEEMTLGFYEIQ